MPLLNIPLTKDNFDKTHWQDVISTCDEHLCYKYRALFFQKATEALAVGDETSHEVFALLGHLSSLMLKLDAPEQPFGPMFVFADGRSATLDDFTDQQLAVLKEVVTEITDAEMQARIADVVWCAAKPRDFRMAILASESYL